MLQKCWWKKMINQKSMAIASTEQQEAEFFIILRPTFRLLISLFCKTNLKLQELRKASTIFQHLRFPYWGEKQPSRALLIVSSLASRITFHTGNLLLDQTAIEKWLSQHFVQRVAWSWLSCIKLADRKLELFDEEGKNRIRVSKWWTFVNMKFFFFFSKKVAKPLS